MNTNRHEFRWTLLVASTSRDEAHPGARASRPHALPLRTARFSAVWHPATLPAGAAWARPKHCPGAVADQAGRRRWPRLRDDLCGRDARAPGWRLFPSPSLLDGARAGLPGRTPADAAEPSPLPALRGPSGNFVDRSFSLLFQIRSHWSQAGGKQTMECCYGRPA